MAQQYEHLRDKAVRLRQERNLTLDQIVEYLALPKTTIYYWIKDIPIARTEKQTLAQRRGTTAMQAKYASLREAAYEKGVGEAPTLMQNPLFRDFVVLYLAEGYKRSRNSVSLVNSDVAIIRLGYHWIKAFTSRKIMYSLQCHADHNADELVRFWSSELSIDPNNVTVMRKSNSGQLSGRNFRSVYGLMTVRVSDTYFRARLAAWMDYVKSQW